MNLVLTTVLAVVALALLQIQFGECASKDCVPTGMRTPCANNYDCIACPSGDFRFKYCCLKTGTTKQCYCGLAGSDCSPSLICCDGSPCRNSTCPPARIYGVCDMDGSNQCAKGTCLPSADAAAAFNGDTSYGTCQ